MKNSSSIPIEEQNDVWFTVRHELVDFRLVKISHNFELIWSSFLVRDTLLRRFPPWIPEENNETEI